MTDFETLFGDAVAIAKGCTTVTAADGTMGCCRGSAGDWECNWDEFGRMLVHSPCVRLLGNDAWEPSHRNRGLDSGVKGDRLCYIIAGQVSGLTAVAV